MTDRDSLGYYVTVKLPFGKLKITTDDELKALRKENNPDNLRVGPYTGRCAICGSKDLWADYTLYGCNICGGFFSNIV